MSMKHCQYVEKSTQNDIPSIDFAQSKISCPFMDFAVCSLIS